MLWLQVPRRILKPDEARDGLALLQALIEPTPTGGLDLHGVALDIGLEVIHSTYDTLYLAFAVAMGARGWWSRTGRLHPTCVGIATRRLSA